MGWIAGFSGQAELINSEVVPWVLALVMAGLGLSLTAGDFRRVVVYPKAAAIGLIAQLIGLPRGRSDCRCCSIHRRPLR